MARSSRLRIALLLSIAASITVLGPSTWAPADAAPLPQQPPPGEAADGVVVVELAPDSAVSEIATVLDEAGATVVGEAGDGAVVVIEVPPGTDESALIAELQGSPAVVNAGFDRIVSAFDAPDDPAYPLQWHMHSTPGGIDVEGAWALSPARGAGVVVAVIDTGVAYENRTGEQGLFGPKNFGRAPDLAGVPIVAPWDWIGGDSHANDEHGHGTHVSGTILQGSDNGLSGTGVSAASLMPLKILDFAGNGFATDLIDAIYYAADNGADVINMSLGFAGTGAPDASGEVCTEIIGLAAALEYADAMGVTVVAAAGNEGAANVACPAAYPTVIAVGATGFDGSVTYYSNRGAELDIAAPGGNPQQDLDANGQPDHVVQQSYCLDPFLLLVTGSYNLFCDVPMSGTSMASPHVAGTVAIMKAQHPSLSPAQIRDILVASARDRGAPGWDAEYGHGLLDAGAALAALVADPPPPPPPGPPPVPRPAPQPGVLNLAATALGTGAVRLDWVDNATNETGFRIDRSVDGETWVQAGTAQANMLSFTNYGLATATAYHYRVRSYDSFGSSIWSPPVTVSTLPPPTAPTDATATALSASSVRVTWVDTSAAEQGFKVERSTDGVSYTVAAYGLKNGTAVTVNSLAPGTAYWFRVRAYDGAVNSPPSNAVQASTFGVPSAPANLVATTLNTTSIRLDWADTSPAEQGFRIERSTDGGATWAQAGIVAANSTTWTNWNLPPGAEFAYRVRAYDGTFNSAPSNVVTAATAAPPGAPADLTATPLSTSRIRLDWVDTASNEQGFAIERSANGGATWTSLGTVPANATTYTAQSLAPGTAYSFRIRGYQGATYGPFSSVATATTWDAPSAPAALDGNATNSTTIVVTWANTSPIQTGVKVERSLDGVAWSQVAVLTANSTSFTSYSLAPGTAYWFRVRAVESTTNGPYSEPVTVSTLPPAPAPAGLAATAINATSVRLTWVDTCTYENGFRIERSLDGVAWTQIAQVGANATSWNVYGLSPATTYHFRVRAYDGPTNGAYSAPVTFVTP